MSHCRTNPRRLLGTLAVAIAFALALGLQHALVVCSGPDRDAHLELAHLACAAHEHAAACGCGDTGDCAEPELRCPGAVGQPSIGCCGCVDTPVSLPTGPLPTRVAVDRDDAADEWCWSPRSGAGCQPATAVTSRPPPTRPPRPDGPLRQRRSVQQLV